MADNNPQIFIRVKDEEREAIQEEAARESLPVATLVRSIVMKELNDRRERREILRQRQLSQIA